MCVIFRKESAMVFSSITFLFYYLPAVMILYLAAPWRMKNIILLLASLIFYAWGAPEFIIQLIVSLVANFFIVRWMCKTEKPVAKKWLCALSIIISMGLLLFYKYGNFTINNISIVSGWLGLEKLSTLNSKLPTILLPIGISFFSFQSVTYTLDTYRGVNPPLRKLSDYMLYITMFPQLIAGPIVRYKDVADQLGLRAGSTEQFASGVRRFTVGLAKKVLIANNLGLLWDVYAARAPETLSVFGAWMGIVAFSLQIYFDFSGYSDMAIGLGRMLGFEFLENFNYPYKIGRAHV